MDKIQHILFILSFFCYLFVPIKKAIHMIQQNRYNLKRYSDWLCSSCQQQKKTIALKYFCMMSCYVLLFVSDKVYPSRLFIMVVCIYAYVSYKLETNNEYRKPLINTKRVTRLFIAMYGCYLMILGCLLHFISLQMWIIITPFLYFTPWILLPFAASIMYPIEQQIRNYYVADAKRLLLLRQDLSIVGISGSYGKTSVKTILKTLLSDSFYTLMTPDSYNNKMGITITIRMQLQNLHDIFLCEMGADHVHEIEQLMDFVHPLFGIVTAIGPQHLQSFHTMENIQHEKMQMIEKLPSNGIGFLNIDNPYIRSYKIKNTCKIIWFGEDEQADYRMCNIHYSEFGTSFEVIYHGKRHAFSTCLLGEHNVRNITCALSLAHTFQVPWEKLQVLVQTLPYVEHRLQLMKTKRYTILDNAYNSNPEGARCALNVLSQMSGRHFIVTPGFIDLGKVEKQENYLFGKRICESCDEVILVGKIQSEDILKGIREQNFDLNHVHIVSSIREAFEIVRKLATPNDTVLLENDLPDAFNH
ncbi:MAG: UDP-N-acetylmuramoyl-tripeptide--D-alanyl-D-alanine ligase [Longicatena sp.]